VQPIHPESGGLGTIGVEYFRGYRQVPPVVDKSDHRVIWPWFPENELPDPGFIPVHNQLNGCQVFSEPLVPGGQDHFSGFPLFRRNCINILFTSQPPLQPQSDVVDDQQHQLLLAGLEFLPLAFHQFIFSDGLVVDDEDGLEWLDDFKPHLSRVLENAPPLSYCWPGENFQVLFLDKIGKE